MCLLFQERTVIITSYGAVHHCHHYDGGADSSADYQWTDPTAGELRIHPGTFGFNKNVCYTVIVR